MLAIAFTIAFLPCLALAEWAIVHAPWLALVIVATAIVFAAGLADPGTRVAMGITGAVFAIVGVAAYALWCLGVPAPVAMAIGGAIIAVGIVNVIRGMIAGASADYPYDE